MQLSGQAEAREWLALADEDLATAERLLQTLPPIVKTAAFHAQQVAENALRAFLAAHAVPGGPTHSLTELLNQCQAIDASFDQLSVAAQTLSRFAVRFRNPGGPPAPTFVEAEDALQLADNVLQFVRDRLRL